jgi:hypothetical protein
MPELRVASINPFWTSEAHAALRALVADGRTTSADDLYKVDGLGRPENPNAVGALFREAHRVGDIERIGYMPSVRASRHGAVVAIWRAAR